jgi:hypothetical protein
MSLLNFLLFFSAISFIFFGIGCFMAPHMKLEFLRYGLVNHRKLVGLLQVLGALGLLAGYYFSPFLVLISAGCLSLLMFLGFGVRIKIKDSIFQSTPALFYALINAYISFQQMVILF